MHSSPKELLNGLVTERTRVLSDGVKAVSLALVLMLWLQAKKAELMLTISLVDVSIPSSYVAFAMAVCVLGCLVNFTGYFVINEFVRIASNYIFRFDAAWMLTVPLDGTAAWSSPLLLQFRYFRSGLAHSIFTSITLVVILLPFAIILIALYLTLIQVGVTSISTYGVFSFEGWLTISGWLIALFPLLSTGLFLFPFRFEKNTEYIRWNLLYRLWKRLGLQPQRVRYWLR